MELLMPRASLGRVARGIAWIVITYLPSQLKQASVAAGLVLASDVACGPSSYPPAPSPNRELRLR